MSDKRLTSSQSKDAEIERLTEERLRFKRYWTQERERGERLENENRVLSAEIAQARAEAFEEAARVAEAEMATCNLYVERKLGGEAGIEKNTARYQTARTIATAIRALKETEPKDEIAQIVAWLRDNLAIQGPPWTGNGDFLRELADAIERRDYLKETTDERG